MGAGLAGALMANFARFVSPDMLHWTHSGELMIMVILGGAGTLFGPALGAAALIGLETVLAGWTEHWQVVLGPILVLIVLCLPRRLGACWPGCGRRAVGEPLLGDRGPGQALRRPCSPPTARRSTSQRASCTR